MIRCLVTYDVSTEAASGRRRLARVAKACLNYGQRVQKSVFECSVDEIRFEEMADKLQRIIDQDRDSIRIYRLPSDRDTAVTVYGLDAYRDLDGPLVI